MKRLGIIALLCLGMVTFHSCLGITSPNSTASFTTPYYPLEVGNRWKYQIGVDSAQKSFTIRQCLAVQAFPDRNEYRMVDTTYFNAEMSSFTYTLVQRDNFLSCPEENWQINFSATQRDSSDRHGFLLHTSDTISCPAGTFHDACTIFFPAAAYDALGVPSFARNIGMVYNTGERPPQYLIGARIGGVVYGKP